MGLGLRASRVKGGMLKFRVRSLYGAWASGLQAR